MAERSIKRKNLEPLLLDPYATIVTNGDSPSIIQTIPTSSNKNYLVVGTIIARRTGGTAGSAGDSAFFKVEGYFKNIGGTLYSLGGTTPIAVVDQVGWDVTFDTAGTDIIMNVTGAVDNIIKWVFVGKEIFITDYN
jgi:hypothetical protein